MALKNLTIPWITGGALLLGYAVVNLIRTRTAARGSKVLPPLRASEPAAPPPESVTQDLELDLDEEFDAAPPSAVSRQSARLGSLFFARATQSLSPADFSTNPPTVRR